MINAINPSLNRGEFQDLPSSHRNLLEKTISSSSLGKQDLAFLYVFLGEIKPVHILEVGLATGSSALCSILAAHDSIGSYTAIDPFQTSWFNSRGRHIVKQNAPSSCDINIIERKSYIALPELIASGRKYDYIFIDSSHMFDETLIELYFADKMLAIDGWLVMDDRQWPMVGGVVNFALNNYPHFEIDTTHPRLTLLRKKKEDNRKWYDFRHFEIPRDEYYDRRIVKLQSENGSGF